MCLSCWSRLGHTTRGLSIYCLVSAILLLAGSAVEAVLPQCAEVARHVASGSVTIASDCSWTVLPGASVLAGQKQKDNDIVGPPAVIATSARLGNADAAEDAPLLLSYLILDGFRLPNPTDTDNALVPAGLGSSSVFLQDIRILVTSTTLQQHLQFFRRQPAAPFYSDNRTFLHVNYFATSKASWQSVGLLLADDLQDARSTSLLSDSNSDTLSKPAASRYNYVLAANNQTLTQHMQRLGAQAGPVGSLIYADSNVTMSKPPVPADGIIVHRPMFLVGLVTANTSFDWHMQVNQIMMNGIWSHMVVDLLELENFAPGDAKSAEIARPISVSSANNFWPLYFDRSQHRLLITNCTFVVGGQGELDYFLYWATVFHSSLPYFRQLAGFLRDVIGVTSWELETLGQDDRSVYVPIMVAGSCTIKNTLYTVTPVVAPPLPRPALDPKLQLQAPQKSPLVTAVSTLTSFHEQLMPLGPSEAGRPHIVLLRSNISLPAAPEGSNAGLGPGVPAAGIPVPQPVSILGDFSNSEANVLDLGFARNILAIPADAQEGQLQVQHLVLKGLAQGPEAAAATDLSSAMVWTIYSWAFARVHEGSVAFSACILELPPPEYDALRHQAGLGGGQVIFKLTGIHSPENEGLFVLNDIVVNGNSMQVGSFKGHGLTGTNMVLRSSPEAADIPGGYYWPGGPLPTLVHVTPGQLSKSALAAAVAVPILVVVVAAAALAALLVIRRRRHRQQKAIEDAERGQHDMYGQLLPPGGVVSSEVECSDRRSKGSALVVSCSRPTNTSEADGSTKDVLADSYGKSTNSSSNTNGSGPFCKPSDMLVAWHTGVAAAQMPCLAENKDAADAAVEAGGFDCMLSDTHQRQLWSMAKQLDLHERQQKQQQVPEDVALIQVLPPSGIAEVVPRQAVVPTNTQGNDTCAGGQDSSTQKTNGTTDSAKSMSEWHTAEQQGACAAVVAKQELPPKPTASGTLFHSVDSALLTTAAKHLHQRAIDQGYAHIASITGKVDAAAAPQAVCTQDGAREEHVQANPAAAVTEPADGAKQVAREGSSKPWQRVSYAISLLQQDITQRRLEAAYAAAQGSHDEVEPAQDPSVPAAVAPAAAQEASEIVADSVGDMKSKAPALCRTGSSSTKRNNSVPQLQLLDMIGRGTFASVHRAVWRGRCVAVKVLHLPADAMEGASDLAAALQTREKMAVMEAVVSITMSHPNIVQVYTFALKPLPAPVNVDDMLRCANSAKQQQQQQRKVAVDGAHGWELQLVMEYCAEGSLRQALNQKRLVDPYTTHGLPALHLVLSLAHDIACAMLHLHSENLIHGDLKASNVLLSICNAPLLSCTTSSMVPGTGYPVQNDPMQQAALQGTGPAGMGQMYLPCIALLTAQQAAQGGRLVAKIADFGLSLSLAPGDTHVSDMHAGTLTHMAPELLLHGRASKPSDVYAFGILFWELITGRTAFQGVPVALLGHNVAHLRWRPGWLPDVPVPLRLLVEECWAQEASARPCFEHVLLRLEQMLQLSPYQLRNSAFISTAAPLQSPQPEQLEGCTAINDPLRCSYEAPAAGAAPGLAHAASPAAELLQPSGGAVACQSPGTAVQNPAQGDGSAVGPATPAVPDLTGNWSLPKKQQQQSLHEPVSDKSPGSTVAAGRTDQGSPGGAKPDEVSKQQQEVPVHATAPAGAAGDLTGDWSLPGR